jgi:hypothetical protein
VSPIWSVGKPKADPPAFLGASGVDEKPESACQADTSGDVLIHLGAKHADLTQLLELSNSVPYLAFSIKLGNAHFYFSHCCVNIIENSQGKCSVLFDGVQVFA